MSLKNSPVCRNIPEKKSYNEHTSINGTEYLYTVGNPIYNFAKMFVFS